MPLPGHQNGQSISRLALTLSVAFLLHIFILAAVLHNWVLQPVPESSTVRFTLLGSNEDESAASSPSQSSAEAAAPASRAPSEPASTTSPKLPLVTRTAEEALRDNPAPVEQTTTPATPSGQQHQPSRAAQNQAQPSPRQSTPSPNAVPSAPSNAGSPIATAKPEPEPTRTQITEQVAERDPYITLLWQYISDELDSRPVRSIRDLERVRSVRLELHLMENGALRRVDTVESSGKPTLDQAARQSALAASPYPEPPESAREQGFRFQVELRFTPPSSP